MPAVEVRRTSLFNVERAFSRLWCDSKTRADLRVYDYWGAGLWLGYVQGAPTTLIAARPLKTKRGIWGRYVNFYYVFTAPPFRGKGYADQMTVKLRRDWVDEGVDRLKARCSSWGGFCYFKHFDDDFWGLQDGDLVVDTPINRNVWIPPGVPHEARKYADRWPLNGAELTAILTDPNGKFRATPEQAAGKLYDAA